MPDDNIEKLLRQSYLKAIENAPGTRLFNSFFVRFKDSGKVSDILDDGVYSCAFFVSSLLCLFGALDRPHATVKSTLESLEKNPKWQKAQPTDIQAGDVIFWGKMKFDDGSENAHVGFAVSPTEAVSADYKQKAVARHPIGAERAIEGVYRFSWPQS